ncbi:MAG: LacI family transcriptional regulator [Deltaproteobacteria bacterium]|jgi:LacI family transcriptional regulator|nr:LacI family transcriptional regulator [Deltaproteobacteria bacterium]
MQKKNVTIRQLAHMLQVTPTTVSLALRGKGHISTARRDEIRQLAARLEYVPSAVAQALRGSATHTIGVVINFFDNPFFSAVFAGMETEMRRRGYAFWVTQSGDDPRQEREQVRQLAERGVDGLIVLPCGEDLRHLEDLRQRGKPVVLIGNLGGQDGFAAVAADNLRGGETAARSLCAERPRVHIAGQETQSMSALRRQGFVNVLRESRPDIDPDQYIHRIARMGHAEGYAAMEAIVRSRPLPLSIFAVNDETALGALKYCRRKGLSVPADVEIVGFGNIAFLDMFSARLSTVNIPAGTMGREAARMLLHRIEGGEEDGCVSILETSFVPGETTLPSST